MSSTSRFISSKLKDYKKSPITSLFIRISFITVALCVAIMILSAFLISGFGQNIRHKMSILYGDLSISNRVNNTSNFSQTELFSFEPEKLRAIEQSDNVAHVSAQLLFPSLVKKSGRPKGLLLKASHYDENSPEKELLIDGRLTQAHPADNEYEICISKNQAEELDAKVGDALISYFKKENTDNITLRKLHVVGIYSSSIFENDDAVAWVDISFPREVLEIPAHTYSSIAIDVLHQKELQQTQDKIWENYLENPLSIESIPQRYSYITDWIELQQTNEVIIMLIMFFIALITMISCILILILDKLPLIGILQTLGAQNRTIQKIFLDLAQSIILKGILWGNIIAIILAILQKKYQFIKLPEKFYLLPYVPMDLDWGRWLIINVAFFIFLLLCLSLASLIVRRMSPVEILRFK